MRKRNYYNETIKRWDIYFHDLCKTIASKSPCLSRQIGAVIVRDKSVISTGYNGPPRGYTHCNETMTICPRHARGYKSGEHLDECPAAHAETNCIANAARIGASTVDSTLYMNTTCLPCKDCMALLINAGVVEVVVEELNLYHDLSSEMIKLCGMKVRRFNL